MDDEDDKLLESGLLQVPHDFTDRVMLRVHAATRAAPPRRVWTERLQWLALIGGIAMGAVEVAAFIFGIWAATAAS